MSEMGDYYDPGPWKGYDYKSARKSYDSDAGRGYGGSSMTGTKTKAKTKTLDDLVPASLTTNAKSPLVIVVDGTGSMGEFPKVMFKKLPLLDLGINDYLDDCEMSFAMVGDAGHDSYPLQVQPFTKGKGLVDVLNKLKIEGGGGGNEEESYDLAGLYYARNVQMPNATKPVLIWVCDEGIYNAVDKGWAQDHARVTLEKNFKSKELFEELKQKYSVYCIRKHYNDQVSGDAMTGSNLRIHKQWEEYLGPGRTAILNDPSRIVDVIFGVLSRETGKEEFFEKELTYRQKPDQVATVMKTIRTMDKSLKKLPAGKSVMTRKAPPKGTTGSLL